MISNVTRPSFPIQSRFFAATPGPGCSRRFAALLFAAALAVAATAVAADAGSPADAAASQPREGSDSSAQPLGQQPSGDANLLERLLAHQQWLEQELSRLNGVNRSLDRDKQSLAADLSSAAEEIERLKFDLQEQGGRVSELATALREKEASASALEGQLVQLKEVNQEVEAARKVLTAENAKFAAALAQERATAEAAAESGRKQLELVQQRLAETEDENEVLAQRLAEVAAVRDRALSANLALQAEKRGLEETLETQRQEAVELRRQLESLLANVEAERAEYAVLGEKHSVLQAELSQTKQQMSELTRQLAAAADVERETEIQIASLNDDRERLESQLALQTQATEEAVARAARAEANVADQETSIAQMSRERRAAEAKLEKSEATVRELKDELASQAQALKSAESAASALAAEKDSIATERDALTAELSTARQEMTDLQRRLKVLQETHAGALAAVERLQEDKATLEADLATEEENVGHLRKTLNAERGSAAELARSLEAAKAASSDLEAKLAAEKGKVAELELALEEQEREANGVKGTLEQTRAEVAILKDRLPARSGGSLTDEKMRGVAAEHFAALRDLRAKRGEMAEESWLAARDNLLAEIRDDQLVLGQAVAAQGLYRVKSEDTLRKISYKFYGTGNRWVEIYEANRHLLEDPDRLSPGMTLIIP